MTYYTGYTHRAGGLWRSGLYRRYGKRVFDVVLVCAGLPVWLPVVGLLWLLAGFGSGSGVYADKRVGRYGRPFACLKIRTMRPDSIRSCAADKGLNDPRITPLGRFLRRSSLDELPQLWCILKGEMSLVGPRPVPELELARYGPHQSAYLELRPGLSGLWQVSGRNSCSYADRVALDVTYGQTLSLAGDLRILGATICEVFRLSGR